MFHLRISTKIDFMDYRCRRRSLCAQAYVKCNRSLKGFRMSSTGIESSCTVKEVRSLTCTVSTQCVQKGLRSIIRDLQGADARWSPRFITATSAESDGRGINILRQMGPGDPPPVNHSSVDNIGVEYRPPDSFGHQIIERCSSDKNILSPGLQPNASLNSGFCIATPLTLAQWGP